MATTRSILRSAAERLVYPGAVLEKANNMLCPDIPPNMFVTCLYALLDPSTGIIRYANAGHNLPFQRTLQGVTEMRVRGMPLGVMPEMIYEEKATGIAVGENIVLYTHASTDVTVQTCGIAVLAAGKASVSFDPSFKAAVSRREPVVVTVTPVGNSNGVYVSEVSPDGFKVVENNEGRSNVTLNYIAIGRRAGYENPSLPPAAHST